MKLIHAGKGFHLVLVSAAFISPISVDQRYGFAFPISAMSAITRDLGDPPVPPHFITKNEWRFILTQPPARLTMFRHG
ncbi:MAG: hypothetical protein ACM3SW_08125 [Actinomycetota bacterium]